LYDLTAAIHRATAGLVGACFAEDSFIALGRLDAKQRQLEALRKGIDAIQPVLSNFEDSLNDSQRTRIRVILPAGSLSAQQSHLDTHYQIEQMARRSPIITTNKMLLLLRARLPKMLGKSHRTKQPLALDRSRSKIPSKRYSKPGFHILT
jgi:hypothetical protein